MAVTALYTAATGMQAMSTKIDVIANNLANSDTVGYKASRANFQDLLYQIYDLPGAQTSSETTAPLGTQIGLGTTLANTQILFQQGSAQQTGRSLDVMIQGDGFFRVELPGGGIAYTRYGNFVRNADGELVLGNDFGNRLADDITIPTDIPVDRIGIGSNGEVTVLDPDNNMTIVGQLQLARFPNPEGLIQFGSNLYLQSPATGEPIEGNPGDEGFGILSGGNLEMSTVEAVSELVELIKAQRVFQMNSQVIQASDETLRTVAALRV
ncbi:MAG: flagellar basal-body rod protein FlgG [Phycisphaerae bacterium]|jgi:flagellar basal-body rod protein FlgG|nr:flagellar basal-body rod protein FlgG [Phycisphaerae bacterium]HOO16659.1 flagellar basal-body rod protein FlgG [Phycisphaerae bacterium]HRS28907.1 flagellar basal-body rod protein FlgG [Phycisphaerae bacterium]HRT42102.1 flagellar basal-body rod protein FlgG [Phycisphaerae bacterium]